MKRFYLNAVAFAIIFATIIAALDVLSTQYYWCELFAKYTDSSEFITGNVGSDEIKPYIKSAQTQDDTTKLIIGDSVCHQMFSGLQEYNDDFTIIGSNGAITMAGQYILAKEYLDNHPNATDVFLIVLPNSLARTFDTNYGYQYTVMPFVETGTINDLDNDTVEIMQSIYGKFFMRPDVVEAIDLSGVNRKLYLNILRERTDGSALPDGFQLAEQYVCKIDELCKARGVKFHIYPCPVSEAVRGTVDGFTEAFTNSAIYSISPDFLNNVYYYPAEQSVDNSHFSGDYANQTCFNEKIQVMFRETELLDMLKFE